MFDPVKYPYCSSGHKYAQDVVSRKIVACKYIIGACKRYLKDLEEKKYPFDVDRAERFLRVVQKFEHVIGEWPTKNIVYEPWQNFAMMNIMGFINPATGYRRYRVAHLEFPRGNGKSLLASQVALFFLALDNPKGNEISCFATKKDQARIVLDSARAMAKKNQSYRAATGVKVLAHTILHEASNSKIRAMSADNKSLDGLNDILSIMDELHAMGRNLFDVVSSGMSKRKDSLMLCITTAGFDIDSVGYSQSTYAKRVATEEVEDDQFFSLVYTVDEGDDIFSEEAWKKANPNYDVSVDALTFEAKAKKAQEVASDLPNFKVKHLNMWLSEFSSFYDTQKWQLCADENLKMEDFKGEKCIVGIDLSSKIDLTSFGFIFKRDDIFYLFDRSYIPEQTVKDVSNVLYDSCISSGHLIQTPGEAIHYPNIEADFLKFNKDYKILECLYDPWNATAFSQKMTENRINMVEFRFTTANLSEPTKHLDALIRQGKIRHNGSPLLKWCLGNVVCKYDAADNVFPRKTHEKFKIDPVISLIMALASWMQKEQQSSIYNTRGIRSF